MILLLVADNASLKHCTLASPQFSELLHAHKTIFLFGSVLPLVFQPEKDPIDKNLILNLRLVCSSWKNTVDLFIQNHPSRKAYCSKYYTSELSRGSSYSYTHDSYTLSRQSYTIKISPDDDTLSKFIKDFPVHIEQNPFASRSVALVISRELLALDHVDYVRQIRNFAQQFGKHIYFLTLKISEYFLLTCMTSAREGEQFLQYFPNLRTLEVWSTTHPDVGGALNRRVANFLSLFAPTSYDMPHLESISIYNCDDGMSTTLNDYFMKPFVGKSDLAKLTRICVPTWINLNGKKFSKLKELTLNKLNCDWKVESLRNLDLPVIEKLRLQFQADNSVNVRILLESLSRFRKSLKHLELDWSEGKSLLTRGTYAKESYWQLKHVHTLKISHSVGVDYVILRWFPNLKWLYLGHCMGEHNENEATAFTQGPTGTMKIIWEKAILHERKRGGIQIQEYAWNQNFVHSAMYNSNIWEVCARLRMIKLNRYNTSTPVNSVVPKVINEHEYIWHRR